MRIVMGVTGGIAAYKACEVVSRLKKLGHEVDVIMTENATRLVAPLTFETLSKRPVCVDTFTRTESWDVKHISLAQKAELFLVAPATANLMAKLACGIADDMLTTTLLATKAPILLAPAMNTGMWTAEATQANLRTLQARGVHFVGPESGFLACGDTGAGRMSELEDKLNSLLSNQDAMAQVMQLAQSLSQSGVGAADSGSAASPPPPQSGAAAGNAMPSAGDLNAMLSQLTGGLDPALLSRLLTVLSQMNRNESSETSALLYALQPFLRDKRRDKVARAAQLAKLIHLAKVFLTTREE